MAKTKVLLSIDDAELKVIDAAVAASGESRSAYIARAAFDSAAATCKRCGGSGKEPAKR